VTDFGALAGDVADAFDLGTPLGPMREVAGGEQARIWRLDSSTGSFAVKEARRGFEARLDGVDIAFPDSVRAQTGVLMPMPVRRPGGPYVVDLAGRPVRVSAWLDVQAPDRGLDPDEVGGLLAALHQVDFPLAEEPEVHPWYREPVGQPRWHELVALLEEAGAPFAATLRAEVPYLVDLEGLLEPPTSLRMCHRDLWSENVLRTATGELCVIDWDNCGPADPSHELGVLLYEFGGRQPDRIRALYQAYRASGGPARLERPGQLTMLIAQFGHFWGAAATDWLDPESTAADRAHQQDRVAELVDPPLRVETCHQLLAALDRA
jgi:Ser/Thr protein kinase RdoA (MazF antagonist)